MAESGERDRDRDGGIFKCQIIFNFQTWIQNQDRNIFIYVPSFVEFLLMNAEIKPNMYKQLS